MSVRMLLTGLGLLIVVAVTGATLSGAAGTASKPKVLCWNNNYPEDGPADVRAKPKKCSLYADGQVTEIAAVHMRKLRWKNWGGPSAVAKGEFIQPMDPDNPWNPIRVRLKRVVEDCGRRVYSKAVFSVPGVGGKTGYPIWTC
jgi:hypothetical protein